jgi:hypothetical protein
MIENKKSPLPNLMRLDYGVPAKQAIDYRTEAVDNFVHNSLENWFEPSPGLLCDRSMTNQAVVFPYKSMTYTEKSGSPEGWPAFLRLALRLWSSARADSRAQAAARASSAYG